MFSFRLSTSTLSLLHHHRHTTSPTHYRHTTDTLPTHHRHTTDTTNDTLPTHHRHTTDTPPTHYRHTTDALIEILTECLPRHQSALQLRLICLPCLALLRVSRHFLVWYYLSPKILYGQNHITWNSDMLLLRHIAGLFLLRFFLESFCSSLTGCTFI